MSKRIMVVDDEIGALTLVAIMLERAGFSVLKAKDSEAALQMLNNEMPDLVILDIMMPGMDGIEFCQTLRKRNQTRDIPVFILSALTDTETKERAKNAGANDFLEKPILHNDIVERVNALF